MCEREWLGHEKRPVHRNSLCCNGEMLRGHTGGQQACKKRLSITDHQGDANQNHNAISPHTCQNGHHQKDHKLQMLARTWRKGNTCTLLVEMYIGAATVENGIEVSQKTEDLPCDSEFYSWIYIQTPPTKTLIWKDTCTPMFIASLYTIDKIWEQPKCPSRDDCP